MATTTATANTTATDVGVDLDYLHEKIPYKRFQECVHCGLCLGSCPTFVLTGDENESPRGRIYLVRSLYNNELALSEPLFEHLDNCLDCRACVTVCPSSVQYGEIIEPTKIAMHQGSVAKKAERSQGLYARLWNKVYKLVLHNVLPSRTLSRVLLAPVWPLKRLGIIDLALKSGLVDKLMPGAMSQLPRVLPAQKPQSPGKLPKVLPAIGEKRKTVALFLGCASDVFYPQTTWNTAQVLSHNGCEVHIPSHQVCCGAIHYHSGAEEPALELARANLKAFDLNAYDAIIVNAAGCGAMLKEYENKFPVEERDQARAFVSKVKDVSEFLSEIGLVPPKNPVKKRVTYHDACHLCHGQGVAAQPRQLLKAIPGLELVDLKDSALCCGAAGTYNLDHPENSAKLGQMKVDNILATKAECAVSGNVGCTLQIERHLRLKNNANSVRVLHPVDLLAEAYGV